MVSRYIYVRLGNWVHFCFIFVHPPAFLHECCNYEPLLISSYSSRVWWILYNSVSCAHDDRVWYHLQQCVVQHSGGSFLHELATDCFSHPVLRLLQTDQETTGILGLGTPYFLDKILHAPSPGQWIWGSDHHPDGVSIPGLRVSWPQHRRAVHNTCSLCNLLAVDALLCNESESLGKGKDLKQSNLNLQCLVNYQAMFSYTEDVYIYLQHKNALMCRSLMGSLR